MEVEFSHKNYLAVVSRTGVDPHSENLSPEAVKNILRKEEKLPPVKESEIAFWRAIAEYYLCTVGEVYKAVYPIEKKSTRLSPEEDSEDGTPEEAKAAVPVTLTAAQQKALDSIKSALKEGHTALLDGVTGSGKTEIYLELAAEVLKSGRQVLVLVPEIALSRQLEERVRKIVLNTLSYHSAKTIARRRAAANAARSGSPYLFLGTRSALFLPFSNLGLIIVDEEHDSSYKQSSPAPRYHARESSIMLATVHRAGVVLGSATPSLESIYNAEHKIFTRVELKQRFYTDKEPEIVIIDTTQERRKRGMAGSLSYKLIGEIKDTLDNGEQVALLQPRRSYASAIQCQDCGNILRCPSCNVPYSLHINPQRLVCHYCGRTEKYTGSCPKCSGELIPLGTGTQRVEEDLARAFPDARIARMDSDNAKENKAIIKSFAKGEVDILVGTQMIAKGFDFPNLTLAGIIQAADILAHDSFRADEQALQLLVQFKGRGGRRQKAGKFVIQTRIPDHPVFLRLQNPEDGAMLQERIDFGFPPYTRLIHVDLKDRNDKRLNYLANERAYCLARVLPGESITGPFIPQPGMLGGEYLRKIRLCLKRDRRLKSLKTTLYKAVTEFEKEKSYPGHITIDVDPL